MMKRKIMMIILGLGWVLLALFLTSGYYFNKLTHDSKQFKLSPVTWQSHMQIFNGAVQCNLIGDELMARKEILKQTIFSKVLKREKSSNSITFYFDDDSVLLESVLEHVQIEKACCPFFKFDISILPFDKGFALQVSGSKDAIEMIEDFDQGK